MAGSSNNDASTSAKSEATDSSTPSNNNAPSTDTSKAEGSNGQPEHNVFKIAIKVPHVSDPTEIMVSAQEQVQDIRQSVMDFPQNFQYSCFHLEYNGERINDFVELSEIPGLGPDAQLALVEDPYTEKEARLHFVRIRELIGAAGDRTDMVHGISAGLSLYDTIENPDAAVTNKSANGNAARQALRDEHAMKSYNIESSPSIKTLLPPPQELSPKTLKAISLSVWNPPPAQLRSRGHLLYIQLTTNEGEQFQITSHVPGFYVNKSTLTKFDPFPRSTPKEVSSHSLLTLIPKLSPSFKASFEELQAFNSARDPLTTYQIANAIPASPWLVFSPASSINSHQPDIARTQETYLFSGEHGTDTLRDWNEEFQSMRELPNEGVQDRVLRERLTSKLFADFNEAAARGAVLIARGEITPLNPTESKDGQIFVYNNIFFSFGADGVGTFVTEGGDEAARVATGKDVVGVRAVNQLDITGLFTAATVVVDYLGKRIVGQSIVPGIFKQRDPGEPQIDYGGVEGKDVITKHEAFVPLFQEMSKALKVKKHAVWDKEKKRHELEASVETKGLIGTDGRKYVLDCYRITPLDVAWLEEYWSENPTDASQKDTAKNYPHRMAVLRRELVDSYARLKLREYVQAEFDKRAAARKAADHSEAQPQTNGETTNGTAAEIEAKEKQKPEDAGEETKKDFETERVDVSDFQFALNPDVYCGQEPSTEEEKEELVKDEAEVRTVCAYLTSDVIPRLIQNLKEGDAAFPMDGESLTTLLHKRGINVRYLGKLATAADQEDPRLQALKRLCIQEMVSRGFKHAANKYLRHLPALFSGACVAHLLNCLLGTGLNPQPAAETDEYLKPFYPEGDFSFESQTPESLREEIVAQVSMRYRYDLNNAWIEPGRELQMLREGSLKLGLQLEARDYAFTKEKAPGGAEVSSSQLNGHTNGTLKNKKKGKDQRSPNRSASPPLTLTFHPDDIQNVVPVIKEASPRSVLAEEALDAGRLSIHQDQKELGQELLMESLSLYEQVHGIMHPEVAKVYSQLATIYHSLEEKPAAVELARKAVVVSERTLGVDSAETVANYLNLSLFEHNNNNTKAALAYVRHALELTKIIYGNYHPDSITTINNAAVMLQSMKQYHDSRLWFEASLAICERVSGKHSISTATLLFQLSQALALDKETHAAVNKMKESYKIFRNILGPDDRNTKEAEAWIESLVQNALTVARQAKMLQTKGRLKHNLVPPSMPIASRTQPPVVGGQTASTVAAVSGHAAAAAGQGPDTRNIDDLVKYIAGGETLSKPSKPSPKKRPVNPKRRAQR